VEEEMKWKGKSSEKMYWKCGDFKHMEIMKTYQYHGNEERIVKEMD